jgi:hypothetical protein
MGYVTNRDGRWYAVNSERLDPLTGRDRRRWHRASDEAAARTLNRPGSCRGWVIPSREGQINGVTALT